MSEFIWLCHAQQYDACSVVNVYTTHICSHVGNCFEITILQLFNLGRGRIHAPKFLTDLSDICHGQSLAMTTVRSLIIDPVTLCGVRPLIQSHDMPFLSRSSASVKQETVIL